MMAGILAEDHADPLQYFLLYIVLKTQVLFHLMKGQRDRAAEALY